MAELSHTAVRAAAASRGDDVVAAIAVAALRPPVGRPQSSASRPVIEGARGRLLKELKMAERSA